VLNAEAPATGRASAARWRTWLPWAAGLAAIGCLALLTWHSWLSAWYANLGEVAFARIQLEGWPTNEWSDGQEAGRLGAVEPVFDRALALNPSNETALYRLGLLAGARRDYAAVIKTLAPAKRADPGHRGITKALAYAYIWAGDPQDAQPLLTALPEAASEMTVYIWWWGAHGLSDLAERARAAVAALPTAQ